MGRVALTKQLQLLIAGAAAVLLLAGGATAYVASISQAAQTVTNAQHQVTEISYRGQDDIDALTLLKRRATVGVKHYSFGDMVTSINGSEGNGPKYWTFYVNGKPSEVGAGAYTTKSTDELKWVLQ